MTRDRREGGEARTTGIRESPWERDIDLLSPNLDKPMHKVWVTEPARRRGILADDLHQFGDLAVPIWKTTFMASTVLGNERRNV